MPKVRTEVKHLMRNFCPPTNGRARPSMEGVHDRSRITRPAMPRRTGAGWLGGALGGAFCVTVVRHGAPMAAAQRALSAGSACTRRQGAVPGRGVAAFVVFVGNHLALRGHGPANRRAITCDIS